MVPSNLIETRLGYVEIYIKYCIKTLNGNIALCCGTLWDAVHAIGLMLQQYLWGADHVIPLFLTEMVFVQYLELTTQRFIQINLLTERSEI